MRFCLSTDDIAVSPLIHATTINAAHPTSQRVLGILLLLAVELPTKILYFIDPKIGYARLDN